MKALIQEIKELEAKELDKLIFLFENELFREFTIAADKKLELLRKMKEEIENEMPHN